MADNQQCLVIKRSLITEADFLSAILQQNGIPCGLKKLSEMETQRFLQFIKQHKIYKPRFGKGGVEGNPQWQQIIFYSLIRKDNRFFLYQRQTRDDRYPEKRLLGKHSIGIGGHLTSADIELVDSIFRELNEELLFTIDDQKVEVDKVKDRLLKLKPVGLLKDESDAVGKDHLGFVWEVRIKQPSLKVTINENKGENLAGQFLTLPEYIQLVKQAKITPERWTEIVVRDYLSSSMN